MSWRREIWSRLGGLLRGSADERELEEELRMHIEMETAENVRRGMDTTLPPPEPYEPYGSRLSGGAIVS